MKVGRRVAFPVLSVGFKLEQRREQEEMASKTARLRALRLAKEAADQEAAAMLPDRPTKTRRSKPK